MPLNGSEDELADDETDQHEPQHPIAGYRLANQGLGRVAPGLRSEDRKRHERFTAKRAGTVERERAAIRTMIELQEAGGSR